MFEYGTHELFTQLNNVDPRLNHNNTEPVQVKARDWKIVKEAIRNFAYENFNPAHLPTGHTLRDEIFSKISSTSALFLALEPQVFVNKIRCRIFKNWKAAESYYTNSLRQLKIAFSGRGQDRGFDDQVDDDDEMQPEPKP